MPTSFATTAKDGIILSGLGSPALLYFSLTTISQFQVGGHVILRFLAGGCVVLGWFLGQWARQESAFLSKPDPEEPPKLDKL